MACATEGVRIDHTPFYIKECDHEKHGDDCFMQHIITLKYRFFNWHYGYRLYRTGKCTSSRSNYIVKGINKPDGVGGFIAPVKYEFNYIDLIKKAHFINLKKHFNQ